MKLISTLGAAALALVFSSCAEVPSSAGEVPAPRINTENVPVAHPDPQGRPNMVVSPYRPYNVIDVKGYRSGDIVGDPSTAITNPSTGRPSAATAKYFRVP